MIGKANHLFTQSSRNPFYVKDMASHFGLVQSSFSQRADTLLRAAGFENAHRFAEIHLGTPDLLVSARRRKILELRERYA
ncbi:MAG: hypothetical protein IT198_05700 [Acidimicrobiia bacterium]|nr:hypothetical protein [Acidimicrobiia bacterium]